MTCYRTILCLLAAASLLSCSRASAALTIADRGESAVTIVVLEKGRTPEAHAARELSDFLQQVTGGEIPVADSAKPGAPRILVGEKAARLADPSFSVEDLGEEGIIIPTVGNDLILTGGSPRGTLYAVYTFLEDQVGCRWWSPTASTIPHRPTLRVGDLNVLYVPPLEYR